MANKTCGDFEPKVITNGDRIRQMNNRQLAELDKCDWCVFFDGVLCHKKDNQCCADGIKPYLDAPAESQLNDAIQNVIKDGAKNAIEIHEAAYAPDINVATKESEGEND